MQTLDLNWQELLLSKCNNVQDIIDNFDTIAIFAIEDCKKILFKSGGNFISKSENYEDIYTYVINDIKNRKIAKWQNAINKNATKGIALCDSKEKALKWIISRLTSEMRNVFDVRYKTTSLPSSILFRSNIDTAYDTNIDAEISKISKKDIINGIRRMYEEDYNWDDVIHVCNKFDIDVNTVFEKIDNKNIIRKEENSNQLFFDFTLEDERGVA